MMLVCVCVPTLTNFVFFPENFATPRQPALRPGREGRRPQEVPQPQLRLQPLPQPHHAEEGGTDQHVRVVQEPPSRRRQAQVPPLRFFGEKL